MRHEILRFLFTGSVNTAAAWMVYLLLNMFLPYGVAYGFAYSFGIVFTYYLNTRWVFKVPMKWKTFMQYPLISAIRFCVDLSLMSALIRFAHCPEAYAPIATLVFTTPLSFLMSRFVLKRKQEVTF
ncbi:MAG TPA: GtrA family protein [Pseudomonadales bacterium]|nr:GtrA family protein [Pseudomonadales bacterium]